MVKRLIVGDCLDSREFVQVSLIKLESCNRNAASEYCSWLVLLQKT